MKRMLLALIVGLYGHAAFAFTIATGPSDGSYFQIAQDIKNAAGNEHILSLLLVLIVCFLIGAAVRTRVGRAIRGQIERSLFERMPGCALLRGLAERLSGKDKESVWKPALAEIEEALVPAFIIEGSEDGRCTVFVPSVPTPFAGAV